MSQLNPSRLFSFLDDKDNYVVSFLEGQCLIADLAINHGYGPNDLSFFRDAVLSSQHLVQFFKNNESIGFYLDSDNPDFHFKIETSSQGYLRALKLPPSEEPMPKRINAMVRLIKTSPSQKEPYSSILQVRNSDLESIMNQILEQSYQIAAQVLLAPDADQSILVSRLPVAEEEDGTIVAPREYLLRKKKVFLELFAKNLNREEEVIQSFESLGFRYLSNTELRLHCPCSKENVINSLGSILQSELAEAAAQGEDHLSIKCHYCNKTYNIRKSDLPS